MATDRHMAQLVSELSVHSLDNSIEVYTSLGFSLERRTGGFAVLSWEGEHVLFLDERPDLPTMPAMYVNVRIMVPDVDARWELACKLGLEVDQEIADRRYGVRDFTVLDPDGFGLRFATTIPM